MDGFESKQHSLRVFFLRYGNLQNLDVSVCSFFDLHQESLVQNWMFNTLYSRMVDSFVAEHLMDLTRRAVRNAPSIDGKQILTAMCSVFCHGMSHRIASCSLRVEHCSGLGAIAYLGLNLWL